MVTIDEIDREAYDGVLAYRNLKGTPPYEHEVIRLVQMLVPLAVLAVLVHMTQCDVRNERVHNALKLCMSMCVLSFTVCAVVVHSNHRAKCPHNEPPKLGSTWIQFRHSDMYAGLGVFVWVVVGFFHLCTDFVGFCKNAWAFSCMIGARIYALLRDVAFIDANIELMIGGHAPIVLCSIVFCVAMRVPSLMCMLDSFVRTTLLAYNIGYTLALLTVVVALICTLLLLGLLALAQSGYPVWQELHKLRNRSIVVGFVARSTALTTTGTTLQANETNINAITTEIATKKGHATDFWFLSLKRPRTYDCIGKHFKTHCLVDGNDIADYTSVDKVLSDNNIEVTKVDKVINEARRLYMMKELKRLKLMELKPSK